MRYAAALGLLAVFAVAVVGVAWAIHDGSWALVRGFGLLGICALVGVAGVLVKAGAHPGWTVVAGMAALFFAGTVPAGVDEWLLEERGRETSCHIRSVSKREGANGSGTVYLHRLDCEGRGPVTLYRSSALVVGQYATVRYVPGAAKDTPRFIGDTGAVSLGVIRWLVGGELAVLVLGTLLALARRGYRRSTT